MPIQELRNASVEMKTIEDIRKLQEINEHIKKEQNSLKFQHCIGQLKGVRRVTEKKTYVCGLCLEPFRLDGMENRCISLCEKCWNIGESA
jgi:hypothetical protein